MQAHMCPPPPTHTESGAVYQIPGDYPSTMVGQAAGSQAPQRVQGVNGGGPILELAAGEAFGMAVMSSGAMCVAYVHCVPDTYVRHHATNP